MSKKFLPLAGMALALAIVSYLVLSLLFPHKKEVLVDTRVKAEEVFGAQLNEAEAQPTASSAEQNDPLPAASAEAAPATEVVAETPAAETPVAEVPAEVASEPAPVESTPASTEPVAVAEQPAAAPAETPVPAASGGTTLTRDQLAKIVAEAAAQAAAETAKSIAEEAARTAASR